MNSTTFNHSLNDATVMDTDATLTDTELEQLRNVRRSLSKLNQGIEHVQQQLKYFNSNVSQTTQLLELWVRVLSQTAHNQTFLANPEWHGGSMDQVRLMDLVKRDRNRALEQEAKREKERREAEERERKNSENKRIAEEAERMRDDLQQRRPPPGPAAATVGGRGRGGARGGRGRGAGRGSSIPSVRGNRIRPPR